jgi:hypothetical protein
MKPIPTLESVSTEYVRLTGLHNKLMARGTEIESEIAKLHAEMGREAVPNQQSTRVASLLSGIDFTPPAPVREQLASLSNEQTAVNTALRELAGQIGLERERASRVVVEQFKAEHTELASRFFKAIAEAATIHAEFEDTRIALQRAGVQSTSFIDFGADIFEKAGYRNSDVGIVLRAAVRSGYLKQSELPEFAR